MTSLVLELQADVLNKSVGVSDLLRKSLVIARKLGLTDKVTWIESELHGYSGAVSEIPEYRMTRGEAKVLNPYHGYQPLNFADAKYAHKLTNRKASMPISEIEQLIASGTSVVLLGIPLNTKTELMRSMEIPMEPSIHVPINQLVRIQDAVRTRVLEWALGLEAQGVLGEGLSFSVQEKQAAAQVSYQITNNIGSMNNSQLQQHSAGATQNLEAEFDVSVLTNLVEELHTAVQSAGLTAEQVNELKADLGAVVLQLASPKPKKNIILASLTSVKTILEGATGNLMASALLPKITELLHLLPVN